MGCIEDTLDPDPDPEEVTLTANAGSDIITELGEQVMLSGSGTSSDGSSVSYLWYVSSGTSAYELANEQTATPVFTASEESDYVITLQVYNDAGFTATDEVTVSVNYNGPVRLSGVISDDRVLANVFTDSAAIDYIVQSNLVVSGAQLTVMPGVNIAFESSTRLFVENEGALIATGKSDSMINFIGSVPAAGHWDGIHFFSANVNNQLDNVTVQHAGGDEIGFGILKSAIGMDTQAKLSLKNSKIYDNEGYGLFIETGGVLTSFANNHFHHNEHTLSLPPAQVQQLDQASVYADNEVNMIEIFRGTMNETTKQTWTHNGDGTPFLITGNLILASEVEIIGHPEFRVASAAFIYVEREAYLHAKGDSDTQKIRFLGQEEVAGFWQGIQFYSNNVNNKLEFVEVAHGGSADPGFGLLASNVAVDHSARIAVSHADFHHADGYGVYLETGAELVEMSSVSFSDNTSLPLGLDAENVAQVDASCTFDNNGSDAVEIFASRLEKGTVMDAWDAFNDGTPYFLNGNLYILSGLEIKEGVKIEVGSDYSIDVDGEGYLTVSGTAAAPVQFVGRTSVPGAWKGMHFFSKDVRNSITHAEVRHGGSSDKGFGIPKANIGVDGNASLSVTSSVIADSNGTGLFVESGATINTDALTSNTFANNLINTNIQ